MNELLTLTVHGYALATASRVVRERRDMLRALLERDDEQECELERLTLFLNEVIVNALSALVQSALYENDHLN